MGSVSDWLPSNQSGPRQNGTWMFWTPIIGTLETFLITPCSLADTEAAEDLSLAESACDTLQINSGADKQRAH